MAHRVDAEQAEEIIGRLLDLFRRMQANFEQSAGELGLTAAEGRALHSLDEPAPMRAMATSLCFDASYITVIADRLEALGLVHREPDPSDRRVKRLVLTDAGRARREELMATVHRSTPALAGLDADQREALVQILRALESAEVP